MDLGNIFNRMFLTFTGQPHEIYSFVIERVLEFASDQSNLTDLTIHKYSKELIRLLVLINNHIIVLVIL